MLNDDVFRGYLSKMMDYAVSLGSDKLMQFLSEKMGLNVSDSYININNALKQSTHSQLKNKERMGINSTSNSEINNNNPLIKQSADLLRKYKDQKCNLLLPFKDENDHLKYVYVDVKEMSDVIDTLTNALDDTFDGKRARIKTVKSKEKSSYHDTDFECSADYKVRALEKKKKAGNIRVFFYRPNVPLDINCEGENIHQDYVARISKHQ